MKTKFTNGLVKGLLFYTIGIVIAWLTYIIFGWEYKHGPGLHHLVAFLFLLIGAGRILYSFLLILTRHKSNVNFGLLTVHILTISSILLYVFVDIRRTELAEITSTPHDTIINNDKTNDIDSIVTRDDDTLNFQKSDSMTIDTIN